VRVRSRLSVRRRAARGFRQRARLVASPRRARASGLAPRHSDVARTHRGERLGNGADRRPRRRPGIEGNRASTAVGRSRGGANRLGAAPSVPRATPRIECAGTSRRRDAATAIASSSTSTKSGCGRPRSILARRSAIGEERVRAADGSSIASPRCPRAMICAFISCAIAMNPRPASPRPPAPACARTTTSRSIFTKVDCELAEHLRPEFPEPASSRANKNPSARTAAPHGSRRRSGRWTVP